MRYEGYSRDQKSRRDRYASLRARLWSERSSTDSHWRDLQDYLQPRRTRFQASDRNKGDKRNQKIIDSTGRFAANTLRSGMHAGLTSPARPWMKLATPDPEMGDFGPVKEWLHLVTRYMLTVFVESNLYNMLPIVYGDMGVFGTAAMSVVEDSKDLFRCYAYPVGSYAIAQDNRGMVSTFVRDYELTVRQVVEEFALLNEGRDINRAVLSPTVLTLWDHGEYEAPVQVTWVVQPNEQADRARFSSKYLPFASCHFETAESHDGGMLRESGFTTFPILAPRWDVTGEDAYGTDCPGMTALGDVKQLQIMQRKKAQAVEKMVDPPVMGPTSLRTQKTSLLPGDITYVDVREGMAGLRAVHEVSLNLQHLREDIQETQYRIQRAFYEDLFLMMARTDNLRSGQPPTAREVEERHEEKLLALGPVLERTNDELLDPLIDRVFELMLRHDLVPPPPTEIQGSNLRVEYTSIMAQAQKVVGVVGQDRFLSTALPLIEAWPEIRHKVDIMQMMDNYADMLGIDPRSVRTTEEAESRAGEEQQAAAAAQEAAAMKDVAAAAKSAGTTPMEGDTALNRVLASTTG